MLQYVLQKKIVVSVCVIVLLVGLFVSQRRGLRASYYPNTEWTGSPTAKRLDDIPYVKGKEGENLLSLAKFSVKWKGYIAIKTPGTYRFTTASDDGSFLRINGEDIVDNGGYHGKKRASGDVFLQEGIHHIEFLYFQIGGASVFEALWTPPDGEEQRIPSDVFYPKRPGRVSLFLSRIIAPLEKHGLLILAGFFVTTLALIPLLFIFDVIRKIRCGIYRRKEVVFSAVLIIFLFCMIELSTWMFLTFFQKQFTFFDAKQYLVSEEMQERFGTIYHPTLGWDGKFGTPYGERQRQKLYDKPLLSSFGDSFTYCDEVEAHETWQTYLSDLLEMDAFNFGIGGYGTDQAYLKFLAKYPELRTPIVMLGLTTENINRIVNVYRPFYFLRTAMRSTKPRFRLKNDELVFVENPIRSKEDIPKLGNLRFIQNMGEIDWWYNRDNYPVFQFPYTKILFNKRLWLEIYHGKGNNRINDADPRPWEDLWAVQEARNMMFRIFDAFIEQAKKEQANPVIVLLPLRHEVETLFATQQQHSRAATVLEYCAEKDYDCFDAITPLAEAVKAGGEIPFLYAGGHVSAKGNRIIANALREYLEETFPEVLAQFRQQNNSQR